jgi:hypothetical protein
MKKLLKQLKNGDKKLEGVCEDEISVYVSRNY